MLYICDYGRGYDPHIHDITRVGTFRDLAGLSGSQRRAYDVGGLWGWVSRELAKQSL